MGLWNERDLTAEESRSADQFRTVYEADPDGFVAFCPACEKYVTGPVRHLFGTHTWEEPVALLFVRDCAIPKSAFAELSSARARETLRRGLREHAVQWMRTHLDVVMYEPFYRDLATRKDQLIRMDDAELLKTYEAALRARRELGDSKAQSLDLAAEVARFGEMLKARPPRVKLAMFVAMAELPIKGLQQRAIEDSEKAGFPAAWATPCAGEMDWF